MAKMTFQKMAAHIEALADGEFEETRAHLLTGALETAEEHEPGHVRAFAHGCDENDYAQAMRPRMMLYMTGEDARHLRAALATIFNEGVEAAWAQWPYSQIDFIKCPQEQARGLRAFLACTGRHGNLPRHKNVV